MGTIIYIDPKNVDKLTGARIKLKNVAAPPYEYSVYTTKPFPYLLENFAGYFDFNNVSDQNGRTVRNMLEGGERSDFSCGGLGC